MPQDIVSAVLIWVIGLIVGAIAINVGARLMIDRATGFGRAVVTAAIGSLVWALLAFFVGWIPLIGPILMLIVWIGIINWQYPGGWGTALGIGIVAWVVAVIIIYLVSLTGAIAPSAVGIPGV